MRTRILAAALTLGFGCAGGMTITATTPELVYIEPGIQVVVDSDVPVFYTDNYYWRYEGNLWYRSSVASGGWIRYDAPPQHLRRIERPQQYVHYRPKDRAPVVRDHRTQQPTPIVHDRQPPARDDRQDRDDGRGKDKDKDKDRGKDKKDRDEHPSKGPH